jgi:tetraacyldisaccharide 4'-kinase
VSGAGRAARWVWRSRAVPAALARGALLPLAGLFRAAVALRNAAYDAGLLAAAPLPLPSIGVGNLAVGGTGKTPFTSYLAGELERRGVRAGIVLRGYGGDEAAEHAAAQPLAVVEADADRIAAASRAAAAGAGALVLDDCLQRRSVRVDVMLALVSADTWGAPRWPLPAGPWREGLGALRRADAVVVTRKAAPARDAAALAERLAPLTRGGAGIVADLLPVLLRPLEGGEERTMQALRGRRVLAVCGIGEPEAFLAQLAEGGATVRALVFDDHHAYDGADLRRIAPAAVGAGADFVVTTAKDAVKLHGRWPREAPPCLVAVLGVQIISGAERLGALLDRVATARRGTLRQAASAPPEGTP